VQGFGGVAFPVAVTAIVSEGEADTSALRVGIAWRELRRLATAQTIRRQLYGFEAPLDQGQGDALEYVVTQGPCRMGDLARFMRVDPSSATRAVERLESAGLVSREADPGDARAVRVSSTNDGLALYSDVRARALGLLEGALAAFSLEDRTALAGLLERLVAAIEGVADPAQ
jgi:DNA-binding MarR family transcriptional regulator